MYHDNIPINHDDGDHMWLFSSDDGPVIRLGVLTTSGIFATILPSVVGTVRILNERNRELIFIKL
jgi:hypothetical protein